MIVIYGRDYANTAVILTNMCSYNVILLIILTRCFLKVAYGRDL